MGDLPGLYPSLEKDMFFLKSYVTVSGPCSSLGHPIKSQITLVVYVQLAESNAKRGCCTVSVQSEVSTALYASICWCQPVS